VTAVTVVLCIPNKHDERWTYILEVKGGFQRVNVDLSTNAVNLDVNGAENEAEAEAEAETETEDECLTAESLCQAVCPASKNCSAQTSNPVHQENCQTANPMQKT